MGAAWLPSPPNPPGPVRAVCRLDARDEALFTLGGRFRNVRQTLELRHRGSSASLIAERYSSRPLRRSSRKDGLLVVFLSHDLAGSGIGGGTVT